jgi:hypothetical protein
VLLARKCQIPGKNIIMQFTMYILNMHSHLFIKCMHGYNKTVRLKNHRTHDDLSLHGKEKEQGKENALTCTHHLSLLDSLVLICSWTMQICQNIVQVAA